MKRTKTIIRILLVLALMIAVYSLVDQGFVKNETPALNQKEAVEPVAPAADVQKPEWVVEPASVQMIAVEEVKSNTPKEKIITESAPVEKEIVSDPSEALEIEVVESDDLGKQEEETGVQIVKISFCDSEFEPAVVMETIHELSAAKGFRIYGNWDETPLDLIVKSCNSEGCVEIHYLDWNPNHPNEYKLTGNLGVEAEVSVYKTDNRVAQFSLASPIQDDYIALDLNEPIRLALAQ